MEWPQQRERERERDLQLQVEAAAQPVQGREAPRDGSIMTGTRWPLISIRWLLRRAVTSAVLTLAGDLIFQLVTDKVPELDLKRTFVFTSLCGECSLPSAVCLIISLHMQIIFSPIFIGVFVSLLVTLEGKPSDLLVPKLKQEWLSSVFVNWQLWISFQFLNFYFVPQVLAASFISLAWNVILSFKAHKEVIAK